MVTCILKWNSRWNLEFIAQKLLVNCSLQECCKASNKHLFLGRLSPSANTRQAKMSGCHLRVVSFAVDVLWWLWTKHSENFQLCNSLTFRNEQSQKSGRDGSPKISSSIEEGDSSLLKSFSLISHPIVDMNTQSGTTVDWVLMTETIMSQKFGTWGVSRTWWNKSLFLKQLQKCSLTGEYNLLLQE